MDASNLERSASSPMATACLFISTIFLILAILFGLYNIGELREGVGKSEAQKVKNDDVAEFTTKAEGYVKDLEENFPEFAGEPGDGSGGDPDDIDLGSDDDDLDVSEDDELDL